MSTERSTYLAIGFDLGDDPIPKKYKKQTPAKTHFEDRFDVKTGKKSKPVEVVDVESTEIFVLNGKKYDDDWSFLEAVARIVGAQIQQYGDLTSTCGYHFMALPSPEKSDNCILVSWLLAEKRSCKLSEIKRKLKALGFKVGEAEIAVLETLC